MDLIRGAWRKSSRSAGNGNACVEVAPEWRKSSRSGATGNNCFEVTGTRARVAFRDSKNLDAPPHAVGRPSWSAFVADVKSGRFDR